MKLLNFLKRIFFPTRIFPREIKEHPYNSRAALALARISRLSYPRSYCFNRDYNNETEFGDDLDKKREELEKLDYKDFEYIHSKEMNILVLLARKRENLIICFRGTVVNNFLNWMTDFQAQLVPMESFGSVHKGFDKALDSVWEEIIKRIPRDRTVHIWLTGHSLGGALALLAGARMVNGLKDHRDAPVFGIYTFGAPRVGDEKFEEAFHNSYLGDRTFIFANYDDMITVAPPHVKIIMGYRDVGNIAYFNWEGKLKFKSELKELKILRNFLGGYFNKQLAPGFNWEKVKNDWNTYKRYFSRFFSENKPLKTTPTRELGVWDRFKLFFTRELPQLETESEPSPPPEENGQPKFLRMALDLFVELAVELNPYVVGTHDIETYIKNLENNLKVEPQ